MIAKLNEARKEDGFTLIELLVVMIIIGILSAVAIPLFLSQREKAQDRAATSDVATLGKEIAAFFVDANAGDALTISAQPNEYQATIVPATGSTTTAVSGEKIGNRSQNVNLGGTALTFTSWDGTGSEPANSDNNWCIFVTNAKGDKAVTGMAYSAERGAQSNTTCTTAP